VLGITTTFGIINYTKRQAFSAWVRSSGTTGRARLALYFYAQDYFDHVMAGLPLRLLGKTITEEFVTGTQDWRKLTVAAKPPFGTALAAMVIQIEDNTAGSFWFDDVHLDAYGAEPLEITASHLGFHPTGSKRFLIKSFENSAMTFTARAEDGTVAAEGEAKRLGFHQFPDRYYFSIELPELNRGGMYRLEVAQGDLRQSRAFTISAGAYQKLNRLLLTAIDAKRMNVEVPGYHEPTHLDDYCAWELVYPRFDKQVKVHPRTRNTLGGFHDAGDRIKHWDHMPVLVFGAMLTRDAHPANSELSRWGERLMSVGLDSLASAQVEDGHFFYADKPYRYDSIPMFGIERYLRFRVAGPQTAGMFARAAIRTRDSDRERSTRYREAAEKVYRATRTGWETLSNGLDRIQFNRLSYDSKQIFGAVYLHKLTGDQGYQADLANHLKSYCEAMEARAYLEPGFRYGGQHGGTPGGATLVLDILWAPTFFLQEMPGHPLASRVRKALLLLVEDVVRVSSMEPWGQAMDLERPGTPPARWPAARPMNYWTMLTVGLARLGMLLDRPELVLLAERQLQWCLGHNPYDVAMAHGVGDRVVGGGDMFYLEPEFHRRHLASGRKLWYYDGNVPTMAFRIHRGTRIGYGDSSGGPISGHPIGHAPMYLQPDYPINPGPTEYWQAHSGPFCAAAAALSEAMRWLQARGNDGD